MTVIGVVGAAPEHERLLRALGDAFGVEFQSGSAEVVAGLPAALYLQAPVAAEPSDRPEYVVARADGDPGPSLVRLADSGSVDPRLRGLALDDDDAAATAPLRHSEGAEPLATAGDRVLWERQGRRHTVAVGPRELEDGMALVELVSAGRWLSLVPLLHFLREIVRPVALDPPPLRAAFLVDDPNLHRPGYGFLSYPRLVEHADEHGYHVAFAMVPLDGWRAHPAAARLFRERADRLSLVFHGNDHLKRELAQPRTASETVSMLAQAQRRMSAFERRAGVAVARVMTPPHGACSRETMTQLPRVGYEAACVSRPYPWLDGPPDGRELAGWEPATFVTEGTPVIPRIPIARAAAELPLRAFLDQPLVVYGHHEDFAGGLDPLADLAAQVERLGPVRWEGLTEIARSNFGKHVDDGVLSIRAYARRLDVDVPEGVDAVRLEMSSPEEPADWHEAVVGAKRRQLHARSGLYVTEPVPVSGPGSLRVSIPHPAPVDPATAPSRRTGAWPVARRVLVEARDRLAPLRAAR